MFKTESQAKFLLVPTGDDRVWQEDPFEKRFLSFLNPHNPLRNLLLVAVFLVHRVMNDRDQQIETLIRLVELNNDPTWLEEFHNLRDGGYLPGGGAGSLNDWGPYYSDAVQSVWFSNLYRILRYLFDNDLDPEEISSFKAIKFRNNIRIIRCLNCDKSYQHPSSFEDHVALVYIAANLPRFLAEEQLLDSISAKALFENPDAVKYRNRLRDQYETNGIRIYDFVTAKYVCPHCGQANCDTEHDLYRITSADSGHFGLVMRNAAWRDFEEV